MKNKILMCLLYVSIVFAIDLEIYNLYAYIVSIENEFMRHTASIAAKVSSGEKVLTPEQQAKLLTMVADKNFELKIFKYIAGLLILLTTLLLACPVVRNFRKIKNQLQKRGPEEGAE